MMLGNLKSVEMAEFFVMLHAQQPVKISAVDAERIGTLYNEIRGLEEYLDRDDISYMDAIEARNDINACKQEIYHLQSKPEPKHVSDAIVAYKQTLSDNAKIRSAQKLSRLYNSRDKVKEEFEKTHVIGMTDADVDKCDRLRMQYKQIKDAIVVASHQKLK